MYYSDGNDSTRARISNVSKKKPELEGGIYSYARAGSVNILDLTVLGDTGWQDFRNVATIMLLFSTLGYFFPIFKGGNSVASIVGASLLLWTLHFLILFGIR